MELNEIKQRYNGVELELSEISNNSLGIESIENGAIDSRVTD